MVRRPPNCVKLSNTLTDKHIWSKGNRKFEKPYISYMWAMIYIDPNCSVLVSEHIIIMKRCTISIKMS